MGPTAVADTHGRACAVAAQGGSPSTGAPTLRGRVPPSLKTLCCRKVRTRRCVSAPLTAAAVVLMHAQGAGMDRTAGAQRRGGRALAGAAASQAGPADRSQER